MIDKYLNKYATQTQGAEGVKWWWNGDEVVAATISSLARHIRKKGCHVFSAEERSELKKMEKFFAVYSMGSAFDDPDEWNVSEWLFAEAMFLFQKWFTRLWD